MASATQAASCPQAIFEFADLVLDARQCAVFRAGRRIPLPKLTYELLLALVEAAPALLGQDELAERVWPGRLLTPETLGQRVLLLRRALGDDAGNPRYLRVVRGQGCQLVPPVRARPGTEPGPASPVAAEVRSGEAAGLPLPEQPSLVVLPFEPGGDMALADILARGLGADVTTGIGRSGAVFVIARGTAAQFGGGGRDVREVGRTLGVRYVVQGSLQASGRRLRVEVAMAEAESRHELWSERYDGDIEDALRVQQEIAELLVGSLQAAVERAEQKRALLLPSANLDAWTAYHRGAALMFRFRADECAQAEHFFRRSIELDPHGPRAYAGLSFVHYQRAFMGMSEDRQDEAVRALDLALRGMAADAFDPMAHWAVGRASLLRGDVDAAIDGFRRAIALNPSYAGAHYSLGWACMLRGERNASNDSLELARRLSPFDPLVFAMRGVAALNLALGGRTAEAASLAATAILHPNAHFHVLSTAAVVHALDGRREQARSLMDRVRAVVPGYDLAEFLRILQFRSRDDIEQLRKAFAELRA